MKAAEERSDVETHQLLKALFEGGESIVDGLKQDFKNRTFKVSDIEDDQGHQYVNLVQEGGGVLGVALLGYSYVMERMGIRFLRLAGTSAGAINAAMLAVVRPKNNKTNKLDTSILKSPIILYYLAKKNLFDLVDGHPIAQWLIKTTIDYKNFFRNIISSTLFIVSSSLLLILFGSILLWDKPSTLLGLFAGLLFSFLIAGLIFSRGRISNGVLWDYLISSYFIKIFSIVFGILGIAWLLMEFRSNGTLSKFISLSVITFLILLASVLSLRSNFSARIQTLSILILLTVLIDGISNLYFEKQFQLRWPSGLEHSHLTIASPICLGTLYEKVPPYQYLSVAGISLLLLFFLLIASVALFLVARFNGSKFGINPGDAFKNWIADLMANGDVFTTVELNSGKIIEIVNAKNGVRTMRDLDEKLQQIPKIHYKPSPDSLFTVKDKNELAGLDAYDPNVDEPPLAIITTELVTENKIVFPKMWTLFFYSRDQLSPADFVRASMSIPFFFEAYRVKNIPPRSQRKEEWLKYLSYDGNQIQEAVFVDGGSLSNFPINIFNPTKATIPRLPTFGARLNDGAPADSRSVQTLDGIIGSIINTIRSYYDKDFLITHPQYEGCLANIDVRDINWLNFNLPVEDQVELFKRGAQAAANFLLGFDWELFKAKQVALNIGVASAAVRVAGSLIEVMNLINATEIERGIERKQQRRIRRFLTIGSAFAVGVYAGWQKPKNKNL